MCVNFQVPNALKSASMFSFLPYEFALVVAFHKLSLISSCIFQSGHTCILVKYYNPSLEMKKAMKPGFARLFVLTTFSTPQVIDN